MRDTAADRPNLAGDVLPATQSDRRPDTEAILKSALESIEHGILLVAADGRILYCNTRFLEIWSLPRTVLETATDQTLVDLAAPQVADPAAFRERLRQTYAGNETFSDTVTLKSGLVVERFSAPLGSPSASVGRLWLFRDVTARTVAEAASRDRDALLAGIFDAAPVGIGVVVNRVLIEVNDALCGITGYSHAELSGMPARILYASEEGYQAAAEIYRRVAVQRTATHETLWRRKDGSLLNIVLHAAPIDPDDGSRGTMFVMQDLTERKRQEEALRASQALLSESQRLTHLGSWDLDIVTGELHWTDECFRIFGRSAGSFQPSMKTFAESLLPEDRRAADSHYRRTLETRVFEPFECRVVRPDGTVRWIHVTGTVICDESGTPVRMIGSQQDINDRKRAEEERLELERRLLHTQKLESLGGLAGGIAHDFNNLLMAILANLELVSSDLPPGSPLRPSLEQSMTAARRAADLTQQMLAYSGKSAFEIADLDLTQLLHDNARLLRTCVSRFVSFEQDLQKALPLIRADAAQLQQAIMNLVTNAAEAIGQASGTVVVSTGVQDCDAVVLGRSRTQKRPQPGRFVYVEVRDDGCGMTEETLQRVFDPFFTTKFMGRGLGMAAVHGIVGAHNGAILVESAPGRGTSVRLLFPCLESASPAVQRQACTPGQALPAAGDQGPRAILVVDDEDLVRSVCIRMLRHRGWQVFDAAGGAGGVQLFREHAGEIACVLLDLSMPQMDGIAVFRALQAMKPDVKVILSSGFSSEQGGLESARLEGLAGFIQKPYTAHHLDAELARVVGPSS